LQLLLAADEGNWTHSAANSAPNQGWSRYRDPDV